MGYPISDHYDGERFYNQNPLARTGKGFADILKWKRQGTKKNWPSYREGRIKSQIAGSLSDGEVVISFINHATLLVQVNGANILTDPVFAERVSPFSWIGPRRVRESGLKISELPQIDFILLSHNHYDHLDIQSIKQICKKFAPQLICPLGNKEFFHREGVERINELDWWQSLNVSNHLSFSFTPAQHWSSRSLTDRNRTLWGGFVISSFENKIFFAGDTGYYDHFNQIFKKFGAIDISLLPIGAYDPRWFMKDQHMNPAEAVQAHLDLKSKLSIGIHFGCFQLTDEAIDDPEKELKRSLKQMNIHPDEFRIPDIGESFFYKK